MPDWAAVRAVFACWRGEVHDPVAAEPAEHLDREITQQPGQPDQVIAGVEDDQDVRVAVVPVPGRNEPADHLADLGGGDLGRIIGRASRTASSGSVQEVRSGSSATTSEYGQPGISCAFPS